MGTILRIGWTNLRRDRVAQAMTFLLPVVFFSIFANVFGRQTNGTSRVDVAIVDEDHSDFSRRVMAGLRAESSLRVKDDAGTAAAEQPEARQGDAPSAAPAGLTRAEAEALVKSGDVPVAVVLPAGIGAAFTSGGFGSGVAVDLLADVSDPIAPKMVGGLLQKVLMTSAPDLMMQAGLQQFETRVSPLTPEQRAAVDAWLPQLRALSIANPSGIPGDADGGSPGVRVHVVDVMRSDDRQGNMISFYAAGIGVMFLLFSSVAAAGGALLEEAEAGTLERLLSTRLGMNGVLAGKWLLLTGIGCLQLTVMFLWGRVAFGLPLFSHVPGFVIMTLVTAGAAAALGLVLAALARSRAQLSGFSTILILTMSAFGGSMFPRFLMSETMQKMGLFTLNAWALDGYLKVFWRDAPLWQLWPQVLVLIALAATFLLLARVAARRWELA